MTSEQYKKKKKKSAVKSLLLFNLAQQVLYKNGRFDTNKNILFVVTRQEESHNFRGLTLSNKTVIILNYPFVVSRQELFKLTENLTYLKGLKQHENEDLLFCVHRDCWCSFVVSVDSFGTSILPEHFKEEF